MPSNFTVYAALTQFRKSLRNTRESLRYDAEPLTPRSEVGLADHAFEHKACWRISVL